VLKLKSGGRGKFYSAVRGLQETAQKILYAGDWPARFWDRVPAATRVRRDVRALDVGRVGREPLKIGYLSDLHIGPLTPPRLLDAAFAAMTELAPDVLLLGGDYVSHEVTPKKAARITELVASVPAPVKLAVLGNHDLWADHVAIERALEAGGARVLVNESVTLAGPHDDVVIVGLDEPWSGDPDPERAFAGADAPVRVVLTHAPEGYPYVANRGATLMMCGHTHGGQIALPKGPVVVHGPLGRKYPCGLFELADLRMYVSRGLGNSDVPLRLNAPPEVALFTLS
jgi:predicted MPP superfamily phosphohydrolase